jgi:hypothetical protein
MHSGRWSGLVTAALAGVLACDEVSFPVFPAEEFVSTLNGAGENPDVATAATGSARFAVADDTIFIYRVDVAGIDSTTLAHIHAGSDTTASGPVLVNLFLGNVACKQNAGTARPILSSSVANPTVVTLDSAHGQTASSTFLVRIAGHTGSTPDLNGEHTATATGAATFTVPVAVTTGGTGGTAQRFTLINTAAPRCRVGFTGHLSSGQVKYNALPAPTPAAYTALGTTPRARFDSLLVLLRTGNAYVNVHTSVNPGGHIRGRIDPEN